MGRLVRLCSFALTGTLVVATLVLPVLAQEPPAPAYRIIESATRGVIDIDTLAAKLAAADVAFLGEQHDDVTGHRVQRLLVEAIAARRDNVTLALEMFERDAQEALDHFQMGHTAEDEFLAAARPWPQYARDYKPLVDFAISRQWPVVAGNLPRSIAAEVVKDGLVVLGGRPDAERGLFAADLQCAASGAYFDRFVAALGSHGQTPGEVSPVRYYESQCLKDETMAESIAQAHAAGSIGGRRPLVLSVNGTVHVDFRLGTVERVARRLPLASIVTVTMVPVADLDGLAVSSDVLARADYVIWTATR